MRMSLVYEYTPLPFVQLRAGVRNYDDATQASTSSTSASCSSRYNGFF